MAVQNLTLASATLSGGATLASAGGGLPQRITTELDKQYEAAAIGTGQVRTGIVVDPDNLHVWTPIGNVAGASTGLRKIRISDGAIIATITGNSSDGGTRVITTPQCLTRRGNKIYCANAGAGTYLIEVDCTTLVCRMYAQAAGTGAVVPAPYHVVSDGTNLWARTSTTSFGTYQEFVLSGTGDAATATATARTIATSYELFADNAGVNFYSMNSSNITKITISTLAVAATYTPPANLAVPGYNNNVIRGGLYDQVEDKVIAHHVSSDTWWYVNSTFNGAEKRLLGPWEHGGLYADGASTAVGRNAAAWADDDSKFVWMSWPNGVSPATNAVAIRSRNIGIQRARWTWVPGVAVTMNNLVIPGDLCNVRSFMDNMPAVPSYLSSLYDFRKTRVYYSINGGARTEYQGEDLAVALAASDTLTVDVDFQHAVEHPSGFRPWVAGANGEGAKIVYTASGAPRHARILGGM